MASRKEILDPLNIQRLVRNNAEDVENYMSDLKNWEQCIKKQEYMTTSHTSGNQDAVKEELSTCKDVAYVKSLYQDAVQQMKSRNWELAESILSKAIQIYNKNPMFFLKRAKCYLQLKRPKLAESDSTRVLALDPKILKAKFYRSEAREMAKNLRGACMDLQDIIILDPTNQAAKCALERLKPLYKASLRCHKLEEKAATEEKGVSEALGDSVSEEAELEKIQLAQKEKELGNNLVKAKKWKEALEAYSKAIKIYPNDSTFYANRALCHINLKNECRAILDCSMALKKNPRYIKAYFRRATARQATGDFFGARYDIKQLLLLEPNNTQAEEVLKNLNSQIEEKLYQDFKNNNEIIDSDDCESTKKDTGKSTATQEFKCVFPVEKPLYARSKGPLKRIPIVFKDKEVQDITKERHDSKQTSPKWMDKPLPLPLIEDISTGHTHIHSPKLQGNPLISKNIEARGTTGSSHNLLKDFKYIFPIMKKPHQQSKKPFVRIPIKFIP